MYTNYIGCTLLLTFTLWGRGRCFIYLFTYLFLLIRNYKNYISYIFTDEKYQMQHMKQKIILVRYY